MEGNAVTGPITAAEVIAAVLLSVALLAAAYVILPP